MLRVHGSNLCQDRDKSLQLICLMVRHLGRTQQIATLHVINQTVIISVQHLYLFLYKSTYLLNYLSIFSFMFIFLFISFFFLASWFIQRLHVHLFSSMQYSINPLMILDGSFYPCLKLSQVHKYTPSFQGVVIVFENKKCN